MHVRANPGLRNSKKNEDRDNWAAILDHRPPPPVRLLARFVQRAVDDMEVGSSFFEVAEPLDHDTFLSVCDDVLRDSLLLLAPFGLPRFVIGGAVLHRYTLTCLGCERLLGVPAFNELGGHCPLPGCFGIACTTLQTSDR